MTHRAPLTLAEAESQLAAVETQLELLLAQPDGDAHLVALTERLRDVGKETVEILREAEAWAKARKDTP